MGLHPEVMHTLEYEGLVKNKRAFHLSREARDFNAAQAAGVPLAVPFLLLNCGDIDIRTRLLSLLKDEYDLIPPFETPYAKTGAPVYSWDLFQDEMKQLLDPFVSGLSHLRQAGFSRVFIQAVVPPTTNNDRFFELHGYHCPTDVRYKVVCAFNRALAERCKPLNMPVVDVWALVTENGYLKPEFEVDGVHLPPRAAAQHLPKLLEMAINRSGLGTNFVRYELFYERARSYYEQKCDV